MAKYLDHDAQWSDPIKRAAGEETGGVAKWHTEGDFHAIGDLCVWIRVYEAPSYPVEIPEKYIPKGDGVIFKSYSLLANTGAVDVDAEKVNSGTTKLQNSPSTERLEREFFLGIWPIDPIE